MGLLEDIGTGIGAAWNNLSNGVFGSDASGVSSARYAVENKNKESYRANGNIYNFGGDVIGSYTPAKTYSAPKVDNSVADLTKQWQDLLAKMQAYQPPEPRIADFDIAGSWNKARQMATKAVSPVYKQKMTDFINRQQVELARQKADTATGKSALDLAQERLLEDTGAARTRTAEDTQTNIADINAAQDYQTRNESLNFDAANRALVEGTGAAGTAESGIGQQQVQEAQQQYRTMSNEEVRQASNKVAAQNTLMNRTFEDLSVKEKRGGEDTTAGKQKLDLDLERFIQDQSYEKDQKTKELELAKQADIAQRSTGLQKQLRDQWIASLRGQGYSNADIAATAAVYS